uniref:Uncharacterized protein n=1 Tax=Cannabis sativa TaxID=3483 RepID=A0A803P4Y7_CANSA
MASSFFFFSKFSNHFSKFAVISPWQPSQSKASLPPESLGWLMKHFTFSASAPLDVGPPLIPPTGFIPDHGSPTGLPPAGFLLIGLRRNSPRPAPLGKKLLSAKKILEGPSSTLVHVPKISLQRSHG